MPISHPTWNSIAPPELRHLSPLRRGVVALAFGLFACLTVTVVMLVGAALFGCKAIPGASTVEQGACQVVDLAKEACSVLKYVDPATGVVKEVQLTQAEGGEMGARLAAKHAAPAGSK